MLAGFFGHKHIATLVRTALAAGTMGKLALVAVGALREAGGGKKIVAAALGSPLLRVAPFWIRHCSIPFDRPRRTCRKRTVDEAKLNSDLVLQLELVSQTRKCIPPSIDRSRLAGAFCLIQILTTARAKPFTVRPAERAARQGE